jgi:hypothetical protein
VHRHDHLSNRIYRIDLGVERIDDFGTSHDDGGVQDQGAVSVARVDDGEEANETTKAIGRVVCFVLWQ